MDDEYVMESRVLRLLAVYSHAHDHSDVDGVLATFTPDATFAVTTHLGEKLPMRRGHGGLREMLVQSSGRAGRAPRRHVVSNAVVERTSTGARVRSTLLIVSYDTGVLRPVLTGSYEDDVRLCEDGEWRFEHRHLHCDGPIA